MVINDKKSNIRLKKKTNKNPKTKIMKVVWKYARE